MQYELSILIPSRELFFFGITTSNGFPVFFKPVFSVGSVHSFFMPNRITNFTSSTMALIRMKWVPMFTKFLTRIYGSYSFASNNVYLLCNKFKMFWITTLMVTTKVINLKYFSSWYRSFKKRINYSVNSFSPVVVISLTISELVFPPSPIPATRFFVYFNFFKESFVFFWRKINFKIFHKFIIPFNEELSI